MDSGKIPTACKPVSLSIEYRPIEILQLEPKNPRLHSEKQIEQIARSIQTFGFNVPVLVDRDLRVIAGHGRLRACEFLGIQKIPTIKLEHLNEDQARAFLIADNRLTENAEWDERLLGAQLKLLADAEIDFSLEVTGFEVPEIDLLIEGVQPAPETENDPADALPESSACEVSKVSDCWLLGKHRLLCGNSLEDESYKVLMAGTKAAMIMTDPPYDVPISHHAGGLGKIQHAEFAMAAGEMNEGEFTNFLSTVCRLMASHSEDGSLHFLFMDWRHVDQLIAAGKRVYSKFENLAVWVKSNGGMGSLYRSRHELVLIFRHGRASHQNNIMLGKYGRYRTNVWEYPGVNTFARTTEEGNLLSLHPTVKPVALVADAMLDCTERGDVVLDPFAGSGTTVIAAERVGRICYAMELESRYVDTAIRRWQNLTGKTAVHAMTGRSFAQYEQEVGGGRQQ